MTGFIRGLFSSKNKQPRAPQPPKPTDAFFLTEDEAKSFGNIDYMRSSKVIKRTFARKKGQTEEVESIQQVSAMDKRKLDEANMPKKIEQQSATTFSAGSSTFQSRSVKTDTTMDMFRNMAKDLKKR